MTTSRRSGCVTGLGIPGIQWTGLTFAYRSRVFRRATFRDRNPPPTGVVIGPLIATTYSRIAARVACGKSSPYWNIALSPAGTGYQAIFRRPPKVSAIAASIARAAAWTTSGPIPSPSITGMIGSSGIRRPASAMRILCPRSGGRKTRRSDGMRVASRPLVEGHVREVLRADVPVQRSEEAVVLPILDHVGRPARDSREGEDWSEEVRRNAEAVEDQPRIEVHVREDALRRELSDDRVLDRGGEPEVGVVPLHPGELPGVVLHDERPGIVGLVDPVPEPVDFLLVPEGVHHEILRGVGLSDRFDRVPGGFDGAAVKRSFQRRDGADDRAVEVRQGRGCHGGPERGRVQSMICVQPHGVIQPPSAGRVRSLARDHPEEILRVT